MNSDDALRRLTECRDDIDEVDIRILKLLTTGTPVKAANDGRVVFAEYLLATGNTIVIEHGG